MHHLDPNALKKIKPTVGTEVEMKQIPIVLIDVEPHTQKKIISVVKGDTVLQIFNKTNNGIQGVQDARQINASFKSEINEIANQSWYFKPSINSALILELFTPPTDNALQVSQQFQEIAQIETDLIHYLYKEFQNDQNIRFISLKAWIDDYNKRHPTNPLPSTDESERMYIPLVFSIKELIATFDEEKKPKGNDLFQTAQLTQESLLQRIQYNFSTALHGRMGSMLLELCETEQPQIEWEHQITICKQKILEFELLIKSNPDSYDEILLDIKKQNELLDFFQEKLRQYRLKKDILKISEINAQKACRLIQDFEKHNAESKKPDRDLFKLEGFFFLLSMRFTTETSDLSPQGETTDKSKYLFFLKTKLSDLIYSLSQNDRLLLEDIGQNTELRLQILTLIAGSSEALTVRFGRFTALDLIESALQWRKDSRPICDRLPNAPLKPLIPPPIPLGLHRKIESAPQRRILLEYRPYTNEPLLHAENNTKNMLERATEFCETAFSIKSIDERLLNKDTAAAYLKRTEISINEKSRFVQSLKVHHSAIYELLLNENSTELHHIAMHESKVTQEMQETERRFTLIERNTDTAFHFISNLTHFPSRGSTEYEELTNQLRRVLFHEDANQTLKQINFLFLKCQGSTSISPQIIKPLIEILMKFYTEQMMSMFPLPLKPHDTKRIQHIQKRYALTEKIPVVLEFLKFVRLFSNSHHDDFRVILKEQKHSLLLEYSLNSFIIQNINATIQDAQSGTMLNRACKYGLVHLIPCLIAHGARAKTGDMVEAFNSTFLTQDMAEQLISAGADPNEFFGYYATLTNEVELTKITNLLGMPALEEAIRYYSSDSDQSQLAATLSQFKSFFLKDPQNALPTETPSDTQEHKTTQPSVEVLAPTQATRPSHSVLYPHREPLTIDVTQFKETMKTALLSYRGQNRSGCETIEFYLGAVHSRPMLQEDVYEVLKSIQGELSQNVSLQKSLNPILLTMLRELSIPDTEGLEAHFKKNHAASHQQ